MLLLVVWLVLLLLVVVLLVDVVLMGGGVVRLLLLTAVCCRDLDPSHEPRVAFTVSGCPLSPSRSFFLSFSFLIALSR